MVYNALFQLIVLSTNGSSSLVRIAHVAIKFQVSCNSSYCFIPAVFVVVVGEEISV